MTPTPRPIIVIIEPLICVLDNNFRSHDHCTNRYVYWIFRRFPLLPNMTDFHGCYVGEYGASDMEFVVDGGWHSVGIVGKLIYKYGVNGVT